MRVKAVPEPPESLETVEAARRAVPLVPGTEDDCCARIMDRIDLGARDEARVWLTFLRGLDLVREGPNGFVRTRASIDLSSSFQEGIYGAAELIEFLDDTEKPVSEATAMAQVRIPEWERRRYQDPESAWRKRVRSILEWLVLLGEARRTDDGYVRD